MDTANLIAQVGPAAATFLAAIASAVVPFLDIEAFLLAAVAAVPAGYPVWSLGIVAAVGQMVGKSALYWSARAACHSRALRRIDRDRVAGLRQRMAGMNPWAVRTLTFVSAFGGVPPFLLLAPAAGAADTGFGPFLVLGLAGRVLRLVGVVLAAASLASAIT